MIQMQQTPRADCNPRSIRSKVEKTPKAAIVFHVHISVTYQELLRQATSYDADIQCEALMHKYQHRLRKGSCSFNSEEIAQIMWTNGRSTDNPPRCAPTHSIGGNRSSA